MTFGGSLVRNARLAASQRDFWRKSRTKSVPYRSVPQECPTRVSHKSVLQEYPTRVSRSCSRSSRSSRRRSLRSLRSRSSRSSSRRRSRSRSSSSSSSRAAAAAAGSSSSSRGQEPAPAAAADMLPFVHLRFLKFRVLTKARNFDMNVQLSAYVNRVT